MNFKLSKWMRQDPKTCALWIANDFVTKLEEGKISNRVLKNSAPIKEISIYDPIEVKNAILADRHSKTSIRYLIPSHQLPSADVIVDPRGVE